MSTADHTFVTQPVTPGTPIGGCQLTLQHAMASITQLNPTLDAHNLAILGTIMTRQHQRTHPGVGDWLRFTDGSLRRISHDWGDEVQHGIQHSKDGSFHLSQSGHVDFSGGLEPGIDRTVLQPDTAQREARFWIWDHGHAGAGRGVHITIPTPVWNYTNTDVQPDTQARQQEYAVYVSQAIKPSEHWNSTPLRWLRMIST